VNLTELIGRTSLIKEMQQPCEPVQVSFFHFLQIKLQAEFSRPTLHTLLNIFLFRLPFLFSLVIEQFPYILNRDKLDRGRYFCQIIF
jgi:hypothetical protein